MLSWKISHFSNANRRLYSESPLTIFYFVSFSIQVSQNRGKQCRSIVLSFDNNNNTINLSATTGFIFPTNHSQQQQQQSRSLFFLHHPDWNGKCGKWGRWVSWPETTIAYVYFWRYPVLPTVDQRLPRMGFYLLVHWCGLFQMRLGTIDNTTMSTMTRTLQMTLVKVLKILLNKVYVPVVSKTTGVRLDPYFPFLKKCNRVCSGWEVYS